MEINKRLAECAKWDAMHYIENYRHCLDEYLKRRCFTLADYPVIEQHLIENNFHAYKNMVKKIVYKIN